MSDNEYERFEVTDYDLANEFNINRPRRHLSKKQQIYGIWADSDNESDDDRTRRNARRGKGTSSNKSKDYTAPVSFVAGGVHQAGKNKNKAKRDDDDDDEITDEEDDADSRPAFGMGDVNSSDEDSSEVEEIKPKHISKQSSFLYKSQIVNDSNVGAWEQHTRGIGAKLLLQMGYKPGKGLGKNLQGISQPLQAHVRKGRGAIGAYGPETGTSLSGKKTQPVFDEDVKEIKEYKEQLTKWKKGDTRTEKKRYFYKSVEEVIEKGQKSSVLLSDKLSKKLGNVPVIDMTGPERRVLKGYQALGQTKVADEEIYVAESKETNKEIYDTFALNELSHNLELLVTMCEQDIIMLHKAEQEAADRQTALEHECRNLEEIAKLEFAHLNILEQANKLVEELCDSPNLTLSRAEHLFMELKADYATEYKDFGLGELTASIIAPLIKRELENWQPLAKPTQYIELIQKWRNLLNIQNEEQEVRNVFDPYSSLIWAGVIPSFRAAGEVWNPKEHQAMATLLEVWAPYFPEWILDSVLEQIIMPRLVTAVREWDPLTDTIPIHSWLLPWHEILNKRMEESLYTTIREKLGDALEAWDPQDRSALAMLTPWLGKFDAGEMQYFLTRHIIPKLQKVLAALQINPRNQDLELWHQVWEWQELIPPMLMGEMLDKFFFPRWMQVLVLWLNQNPDFAEISRWYTGWKSMISEEVLREPNVKEHLRRALEMMQRATDVLTANLAGMSGFTMTPPPPPPPPMMPTLLLDASQLATPMQLEFKELVSQKCAERGIIFAPLPGRREMGKQIYRVGKLFCYIDRNVCMLSDASCQHWRPTSLMQLMESAQTGIII